MPGRRLCAVLVASVITVTAGGLANLSARAAAASSSVTNYLGPGISHPSAIALGPDGSLWFGNTGNGSIAKMSPTGTVTNYRDPGIPVSNGIAAGPDGAMWFTSN